MLTTHFIDADILTIADVFSASECLQMIDMAESAGFRAASVRTRSGPKMMQQVRNNDRVNFVDEQVSHLLWSRIAHLLPVLDGRRAVGVDPNLRVYRYQPGQRFRRHKDGVVANRQGQVSKLSYLVYLNQDFSGGGTQFRDYVGKGDDRVALVYDVTPQTGLALLFAHHRWHEGMELTDGCKYVLRTDVFYQEAD